MSRIADKVGRDNNNRRPPHGDRRVVSTAYLTFVAVDRHGRRRPVPPVLPETDEEKRRFEDAGRRRQYRMEERARKATV